MLKQKVISQKLGARNHRLKTQNRSENLKKTLYRLKYESTKSTTNMHYDRIKEMERQETELLDKLK